MTDIALLVDGTRYGGWLSLDASAGVEYASGSFRVFLTERWPGQMVPMPVSPGVSCELQLGGQTIISGWIDTVERGLRPGERAVQIGGRDKTADLVDCSAQVRQYRQQDIEQIATDQCEPYGVSVSANLDVSPPFPKVAVEPGETVFELIERLARQRGLLVMADGQGGLLLGKPAGEKVDTALVEGQNCLAIVATADWRERMSDYIVRGQSAGDDNWNGAAAAHQESAVEDAEVKSRDRYRPLIVLAEDGETDLEKRAEWERRVRYGRSLRVGVQVQGWEHEPGALWRAGDRVQLSAPSLNLDEELLIAEARYTLDESGTITALRLARPEAYELQQQASEASEEGAWWS